MSEPPRDPVDGYSPADVRLDASTDPAEDPNVLAAMEHEADRLATEAVQSGRARMDDYVALRQEVLDGFRNVLTGIGDPTRDKTLGGRHNGPHFHVQLISGFEAEQRWRGSALGRRIVGTIPNEMTRRGWDIVVQPDEKDAAEAPPKRNALMDSLRRLGRRFVKRDDFPAPPSADPPHTPGELPPMNDEGTRIVEKLEADQRKLRLKECIREALCYKRAYGGGAVFLGADDGEQDLTKPLDPTRLRRFRHLTTYRGGWDGELIAWRYYNDPRHPKFGEPEIYMLRNIGVPISGPPAPGETNPHYQVMPAGPAGGLIFYVHESRLLVFSEQPASRRVRVANRGWGDSIWVSVNETLSQYSQSWNGVSILLQEYSSLVLTMDGYAAMAASRKTEDREKLLARLVAMQMAMSVAKARIIDSKEKIERLSVPMNGLAEVLREIALNLSGAVGMPVSMLMGQVQGGLGDASKGDIRFFYDTIEGQQDDEMMPQVERFTELQLRALEGPTGGRVPQRWSCKARPIWQMTDAERAQYRKTIAETDKIYVDMGGTTPEEVIGTRFGGSDFNDGPIVLDLEGRAEQAARAKQQRELRVKAQLEQAQQAAAQQPAPTPPTPPAPPSDK